jgi:hypothetical protein
MAGYCDKRYADQLDRSVERRLEKCVTNNSQPVDTVTTVYLYNLFREVACQGSAAEGVMLFLGNPPKP